MPLNKETKPNQTKPSNIHENSWKIIDVSNKYAILIGNILLLTRMDRHTSVRPLMNVIFWPPTRPKNAIPRWCTGSKWHIPTASNRKRSCWLIKADNMGQGEGPTVPLQSDAPEESDIWTAWQLFPLDDD